MPRSVSKSRNPTPVSNLREIRATLPTIWVGLVFFFMFFCYSAVPVARGQTQGQWAAPVYFCSGNPCVVGANAAVLNTGSVLFYYYPSKPGVGSQALLLNPISGVITSVSLTVSEDIFCSGLTILENGNV